MNHLIVFAHPYAKSFGKAIAETARQAAVQKGASVRVRDLYEIGFDPVLKGSDLLNLQTGQYADDIKEEQEHIHWADVITFVYPVWWAGLPAMLKGYVDRVFANGFAFASTEEGPVGKLQGKKASLLCTTGFPSEVYTEIGMHASMKQTSDEAIFQFCGLEVIQHVFFGGIPQSTPEARTAYLEEVAALIGENC